MQQVVDWIVGVSCYELVFSNLETAVHLVQHTCDKPVSPESEAASLEKWISPQHNSSFQYPSGINGKSNRSGAGHHNGGGDDDWLVHHDAGDLDCPPTHGRSFTLQGRP